MERFNSLEGKFLVAMPKIGDQRFESTVILICAHSEEGAMGFVINRLLPEPSGADFLRKLGIVTSHEDERLPEKVATSALNVGGPVEPGRGFVLHSPDYRDGTTIKVTSEICLTATLDILRHIVTGNGPEHFFLALGYSGWSMGQLEREIAANGWLIAESDAEMVFFGDREGVYNRVMQSMGINPHLISGESGHA
jgi:putative transcriptional regulator